MRLIKYQLKKENECDLRRIEVLDNLISIIKKASNSWALGVDIMWRFNNIVERPEESEGRGKRIFVTSYF